MRTNLPVTQTEVQLKDDTLIVSKTDMQGRLTYVNQDFLDISGFTESELIGQPHNIVRHPDMPVEAFADLWRTLQAGRPWIGYVKNRCKNGDYYWVEAHAAPLMEGGQQVGYISVRRKPARTTVEACEAAYRMFRENRAGGKRVELGQVVSGMGVGRKFRDLSITLKIATVTGILAAMIALVGITGILALNQTNEALRTVYDDRTVALGQLAEITGLIDENRQHVADSIVGNDAEVIGKHMASIDKNVAKVTKSWDAYMATYLTPEEKVLAEQFATARATFVREGLQPAIALLKAGKTVEARQHYLGKVDGLHQILAEKGTKLVQLQLDVAKQEYDSSVARYNRSKMADITLIVAGLILALLATLYLRWAILRPVEMAKNVFERISQGDNNAMIDVTANDEMGQFLQKLESVLARNGFENAEFKRAADATARIKIALDNVSTGVMIANRAREIIYVNKAVQRMLKSAEADIRKQLPNFTADTLLGTNIDVFHKNPSHQANLLASFTSPYTANLEVGGRHLRVTASPVINDRNERLGAVAEWLDRTQEVKVELEVAGIVAAAQVGDFNQRLSLDGKEGFFKQLAEGLNSLAQVTSVGLNDVARVLQTVAQGDLTQKIEGDYSGIFGQLKDDTNATVERLKEVVGRIKDATEAINTAASEIAAGNQDLSSRTEEQASSLEETSSSMEELNATVRNNAESANRANQLAKTSNDGIRRGGEAVKQVVVTMGDIQDSSKKIADIITVIDSIAFQTNILALNAAVEAARAGEQGRGFAVVATEVRNLAQRSATAAKEIKDLIAASVEKVEVGVKQVEAAGTTMEEVVTSFSQVAALVTDISNASREQSSGIEQVTQAVSSMDEVTQQNAALVEQAAAAAESLEEQARGLVQAVGMFKLAGGQSRLPALASHAPVAKRPVAPRPAAKALPKKAGLPPPEEGEEWAEF